MGGLSLLYLTPWVAAAVVLLLIVVVLSYRQTCHAYPNGGGAYAVSRANLGRTAALVAASALLVDYVLTVAVSVAAGVANIVSAVPSLAPHAVLMSAGLVVLLAVMNLRGVKESGTVFAIPTYGFVLCVLAMIGTRAAGDSSTATRRWRSPRPSGSRPSRARVACLLVARRAARVRVRLHGADRGGGGQQRRPELQDAEEPQRRRHPGDHGRADHRDVRRASPRWR